METDSVDTGSSTTEAVSESAGGSHPKTEPSMPNLRRTSFDEKLLIDGLFSDVKVKCGDREWKLHKAIICTRCDYFRAAFTGGFKETATGEMTIHEQEPHKVGWLITCIYTGKAVPELAERLENRITLPQAAAEVLEVADYFCHEALEDLLADYIRPYFLEEGQKLQDELPRKADDKRDCSDTLLCDFMDPFFSLAKAVYAHHKPSAKLHQTFMEFFSMTRFGLLDDEPHRQRFETIPILCASVLTLFMAEQYGNHWAPPQHELIPETCEACLDHCAAEEENQVFDELGTFTEFWYDENRQIHGRCKYCAFNNRVPQKRGRRFDVSSS